MKVEIRLLGGYQVLRDGAPAELVPSRVARSLLGYFAVHAGRTHTRDLIIGTFWPDEPEDYGRKQLRQALYQLKRAHGIDESLGLRTTGDPIGLIPGPGAQIDVLTFEHSLDQAAAAEHARQERTYLESALSIYRGPLLAGFYEDWIHPERDRLERQVAEALDRAGDLAQADGEYQSALDLAYRRIEVTPANERPHRRVMRILALLGRHDEAIRHYGICKEVLGQELGVSPSPAARELRDDIAAETAVSAAADAPPVSGLPLIGREAERTRISRLLDRTPTSRGAIVLVEGEPGVGKTRLLRETERAAHWRGFDVFSGTAGTQAGQPYGPIAEAFAGISPLRKEQVAEVLGPVWRAAAAPVLGGLQRPGDEAAELDDAAERVRTHEAVVQIVDSLIGFSPILMTIDDLHLADRETIAALRSLAAGIGDRPMVLVATYRHAEARDRPGVWDLLVDLDGQEGVARVALAPLTPAQTEDLIKAALGPEAPADVVDRIQDQSGGVPLLVVESTRGDEGEGPGGARMAARRKMQARIEALDRGVEVLDVLSTAAVPLRPEELLDALDVPEEYEALDDLMSRGLVAERNGMLSIAHDLLRQTVVSLQPETRQRALHQSIALAIRTQRPDAVEALAHHFEAAANPDQAAPMLQRAAERAAAAHALEDAADLYDRCMTTLEQSGAPPATRISIAFRLESLLDTLDRHDRQGEVIDVLATTCSEAERPEMLRRRARWLLHRDNVAEAEEAAREAVDAARQQGDRDAELGALTELSKIASLTGRAAEGAEWLAAPLGKPQPAGRTLAEATRAYGQNLLELQRFEESEANLHRALAMWGEIGDQRGQANALGALGVLRLQQGRLDQAESRFTRAAEICHRIGYRRGEAMAVANLGLAYAMQLRVALGVAELARATHLYSLARSQRGRFAVQTNEAWLRCEFLGDEEGAFHLASESLEWYRRVTDHRGEAQCLTVLAAASLIAGTHGQFDALMDEAISLAIRVQDGWIQTQQQVLRAEALLQRGDPQLAHAMAERAERAAAKAGTDDLATGARAVKLRALAMLGDPDRAVQEATQGEDRIVWYSHKLHFAKSEVMRLAGMYESADLHLTKAHRLVQLILEGSSGDVRARALQKVDAFVRIESAYATRQGRLSVVQVPRHGAPLGRAPLSSERVAVTWEAWLPSDEQIDAPAEHRRARLARFSASCEEAGARPAVPDIARALDVSISTVRRDLTYLRERGEAPRTRGDRQRPDP